MTHKKANILGLMVSVIFIFPSYAHARDGYGELIGSLLVTFLITCIIFLILREVVCWYWKINETLNVLKEIRDLLKEQSKSGTKKPPQTQIISPHLSEQEMYEAGECPECAIEIEKDQERCIDCGANLLKFMIHSKKTN